MNEILLRWVELPYGVPLLLVTAGLIGGCIGSFLNVVVYRLPLGLSLSHPPSRCPRCEHRIRPWHNIPVLGWVILGGRCRDCRAPISVRYPLVELAVAAIFVAMFAMANYGARAFGGDEHAAIWWPWLAAALLRSLLFTSLLGAALMEYDRSRVPARLFFPVLGVGLALCVVVGMGPLIPQICAPWNEVEAVSGALAGAVVGLAMGGAQRRASASGWIAVGIALDLMVTLLLAAITLACLGVRRLARSEREPWPTAIYWRAIAALATLACLAIW
jgi:prepilin signal peptidase PulO-like enzyme (type II secretory pathway)